MQRLGEETLGRRGVGLYALCQRATTSSKLGRAQAPDDPRIPMFRSHGIKYEGHVASHTKAIRVSPLYSRLAFRTPARAPLWDCAGSRYTFEFIERDFAAVMISKLFGKILARLQKTKRRMRK